MQTGQPWETVRSDLLEAILRARDDPRLMRKELALAALVKQMGLPEAVAWLAAQERAFSAEMRAEALALFEAGGADPGGGVSRRPAVPGVYAVWRLECALELAETAAENPGLFGPGPEPSLRRWLVDDWWEQRREVWLKLQVLDWQGLFPFYSIH